MSNSQDKKALNNARKIIEKFGGIRPMSTKTGVPVTTIQGWKKRDVIPGNRYDIVVNAAAENNIDLSAYLKTQPANANEATPKAAAAPSEAPTENIYDAADSEAKARQAAASQKRSEIAKQLSSSQESASMKNIWVPVGMIAAMAIIGVLLWPQQQQTTERLAESEQRLEEIESNLSDIQEKQNSLSRLIPSNLSNKVEGWKEEADNIKTKIQTIQSDVKDLKEGVIGADAGPLSQRLSVLEEKIENITGPSDLTRLMQKVSVLQQSIEGQNQLSDSVSRLGSIVTSLEGRVDNVDEALQKAREMDDSVAETLEGVPQDELKAAALLLGLSQFRSSLNREEPFEEDLALLQKLVGQDNTELQTAITGLAPKAESGVLTPSGLSSQFKGLAGDIVVSSLKGEDVSFKEKAAARLGTVLEVQKDGEMMTGTDTQATVARAQAYLDEGNVQAAIKELETLEGPAADTAQPFINEAAKTLLAEDVQEMLTNEIMGQIKGLAGKAGGSGIAGGLTTGGAGLNPQRALDKIQVMELDGVLGAVKGKVTDKKIIRDEDSGLSILPQQ